MGFAQAGTSHHDGDDLAIAGAKPNGMAAQGSVIWRAAQPFWNLFVQTMVQVADALNTPDPNGWTASSPPIDTTGASLILMVGGPLWAFSNNVSDSLGNTWALAGSMYSATKGAAQQIFYCINPVVGAGHTFSVDNWNPFYILCYKTGGAVAFDQAVVSDGLYAATPVTLPPLTPSANNALLVLGMCWYGYPTTSVDSGFTIQQQWIPDTAYPMGGAVATLNQATAATVAPTWTRGATCETASVLASFIPGG